MPRIHVFERDDRLVCLDRPLTAADLLQATLIGFVWQYADEFGYHLDLFFFQKEGRLEKRSLCGGGQERQMLFIEELGISKEGLRCRVGGTYSQFTPCPIIVFLKELFREVQTKAQEGGSISHGATQQDGFTIFTVPWHGSEGDVVLDVQVPASTP